MTLRTTALPSASLMLMGAPCCPCCCCDPCPTGWLYPRSPAGLVLAAAADANGAGAEAGAAAGRLSWLGPGWAAAAGAPEDSAREAAMAAGAGSTGGML